MTNIKIVTFVPVENADAMRRALGDAGAGNLGDYRYCSFSFKGVGRFTPEAGADPHIGEIGKEQLTDEERIEVICQREKARAVVAALRSAHPYEEPVFDIIALIDEDDL